jgi:membrane protein implicated in regulation of membrane protease activity
MQKSKTIKRYILFQIPEFILTIAGLYIIKLFYDYPIWLAVVVLIAAIVKDIILFFRTWRSYIVYEGDNISNIIGKTCTAITDFEKKGKVRLDGEIWNAENVDEKPVEKNKKLLIKGISGLRLFVGQP